MTTDYFEEQAGSGAGVGGVMVAFLAGAAVGAAVALLYAPAPGEETRAKVSDMARGAADSARRGARQIQGTLNDSWQRAVDAAKDAFEAALQRD
jgi:gas vesicle protein